MKKVINFLRGNKGSGEIIGLALVIIFVVIVPSASIKKLGVTIKGAFDELDTQVQGALNPGK